MAAAGITAGVVLSADDASIVGTWEGTRTIDTGPLFSSCVRRFTEIWTIQQSGTNLTADVQAIGEGCGSPSCAQNCNIFWFPRQHFGTWDGSTARLVVFGGTTCVFSLRLSGDTLAGSMSPRSESPGMTQDVSLTRKP